MIIIRKAIPEDTKAIIDFQQKMAWETEQMFLAPEIITHGVNAVFSNPVLGQYWVAEEIGQVIASLLITYECSDWRNTNVWWFQSVYVETKNSRAQKTYEALGMKSEHYTMYEWMKE